ncbi:MAG: hypothetical protein ACI8RE_000748 [Ilumatobacter sp.]|jgi:hypothetical protein
MRSRRLSNRRRPLDNHAARGRSRPLDIYTYPLGHPLENDGLSAVDHNLECPADLSHPYAAQSTDPFDQHCG